MNDTDAKEIAVKLDEGLDGLFAANSADKVKIIKAYLDEQIGSEPHAQFQQVPGMPMLTGFMLEGISDVMLDAVASVIVKKFFTPTA